MIDVIVAKTQLAIAWATGIFKAGQYPWGISMRTLLIAAALCLGSCASSGGGGSPLLSGLFSAAGPQMQHNAQGVAAATKSEYNPHKDLTSYVGPRMQFDTGFDQYFLRAWCKGTCEGKKPEVQLYVTKSFKDWAFIKDVWWKGNKIPLTEIDRQVISCHRGCLLREDVGLDLSDITAEQMPEEGLTMQFSGRGGSFVLTLPKYYFDGFMRAAGSN